MTQNPPSNSFPNPKSFHRDYLTLCQIMRKRTVSGLALCLVTGISVAPLSAQQAEKPGTNGIDSTSRKPQDLDTVRVDGKPVRARYAPGYTRTATKTPALARDIPQSLVTVTKQLVRDQAMQGMSDVIRYVPGATMGQGEGNRDQVTIRGNNTTADFFVDGVRDDVQYFRDLYNLERVEALKGSNAMVFGRGGGGGILNRVTKEAGWSTNREVIAELGTFGTRRFTTDIQQNVSPFFAARLNSVYENSDLYRDGAGIERSGFNPTLTIASRSRSTRASIGYEWFDDHRTADRGIPSYLGRPLQTDPSTFFGNADESFSKARVNSLQATLSHDAGSLQIRNHTRFANYDKFYQNVFPGAVTTDGSKVSISGYNNSTDRRNIFNQTDLTLTRNTGSIVHDVLVGAEVGRQSTENFRETARFGSASSVLVSVSNPRLNDAVTFSQSATDADNSSTVTTRSFYVQDQLSLSRNLRVIGGLRYESFGVDFTDNRGNMKLDRHDAMLSPRVGVVVKPREPLSVYASYSISYLPGSGDQFSSLTEITSALEPEQFTNYEAGVKWDAVDRLALSAAAYRLNRTNTRSIDPVDPRKLIQTGSQRSQGIELGATGNVTSKWEIAAGYARQNAKITSATASSPAGARVPLVPHASASLWNRFNVTSRFGAAIGAIHQSSVFTGIDNTVSLPSFNRFDGALYASLGFGLKAQVNVENIFNTRYFATAHSNNNITPGSPRAARLSLSADF